MAGLSEKKEKLGEELGLERRHLGKLGADVCPQCSVVADVRAWFPDESCIACAPGILTVRPHRDHVSELKCLVP